MGTLDPTKKTVKLISGTPDYHKKIQYAGSICFVRCLILRKPSKYRSFSFTWEIEEDSPYVGD